MTYPATPVTVTDNDTEEVTISVTTLSITEAEGAVATATYDVSLNAAPVSGTVTVNIDVPNNTDVTVVPTSLTFRPSDWTSAGTQTVTKQVEVRVADDAGAGDDTASITHTLSGASYALGTTVPGIEVTVTDSDTRGVTITAADPSSSTRDRR